MRWNENEMKWRARESPDFEGKLIYKPPPSKNSSAAKTLGKGIVGTISGAIGVGGGSIQDESQKWFRLKGNLLFYFRMIGGQSLRYPTQVEPQGVLVLEHFHIQRESFEEGDAFSLIFANDPTKKHVFIADNQREAYQWDMALRDASFQGLREKLLNLQIKLRNRLESDPLKGSLLQTNPIFANYTTTTSHLLQSSRNQVSEALAFGDLKVKLDSPPKPKPRTKNKKGAFKLHALEDLESESPTANPTFQCHLPAVDENVPVGPLLDL